MSGPILIFDSGVGGLSVVKALREQMPGAPLAYVCDNAALPYGTKADAWLVRRIVQVCRAAVAASGARVLVVACNTASTLALDALRDALAIPVVGTVPAIKPAAALSRSGVIGLLATSAAAQDRRPSHCIDVAQNTPGVEVLHKGVTRSEDQIDGAMIFATGWAPFRGGPMHYARSRGIEEVTERLRELEREHGPRFAPNEGWSTLA